MEPPSFTDWAAKTQREAAAGLRSAGSWCHCRLQCGASDPGPQPFLPFSPSAGACSHLPFLVTGLSLRGEVKAEEAVLMREEEGAGRKEVFLP